jgi:phosphoglycerate kinase
MTMATLDDIRALDDLRLESQRVLIRVDFDVPVDDATGGILDDAKIRAALPTLQHAMEAGARVILATHRGDPEGKPSPELGLEPIGAHLANLTGWDVLLPDDCVGDAPRKVVADLRGGQVVLLENLGFAPGESRNDEGFARRLATLCDVYVNEAFTLAHLSGASLVALPRLMPQRGAGRAFHHELVGLGRVRERVDRPLVLVLGGRRLDDKLEWLSALGSRCDCVCWGGAVASTLLGAQGVRLPRDQIETDRLARARTWLDLPRDRGPEIVLPVDLVVDEGSGEAPGRVVSVGEVPPDARVVDVGPRTLEAFAARISRARTVLWHGPLGCSESATIHLAEQLCAASAFTVVIGDATTAAVRGAGVAERLGLVSSGGEAARRWLRGERLPALEVLRGAPG